VVLRLAMNVNTSPNPQHFTRPIATSLLSSCMAQRPDIRLAHHPSDAPIAAWAADMLTLGGVGHVQLAPRGRAATGSSQTQTLWLAWRRPLAQAVHLVRAQVGISIGQMAPITPAELRSSLEAVKSHMLGLLSDSASVLYAEDLANNFAPTLRSVLAAVNVDGKNSPFAAPAMTADAIALLDAYTALVAPAAAELGSAELGSPPRRPSSTGGSSTSDPAIAVAATLSMQDYYTMRDALGGHPALGGTALLHRLESVGNATRHSRRDRRQALVRHVAVTWAPATARLRRDGVGSAAYAQGSVSPTALALARLRSPPCHLVSNLAQICLSFVGTSNEAAFAEVSANGCRCPPRPPSQPREAALTTTPTVSPLATNGLMVGTHHKTGTVLLEKLLLEISKQLELPDGYSKPRWAACEQGKSSQVKHTSHPLTPPHSPTQLLVQSAAPQAAAGAVAGAPSRARLPTLEELFALPPADMALRWSSVCVDEHVSKTPEPELDLEPDLEPLPEPKPKP